MFIGQKHDEKDMKTIGRSLFAAIGALCFLCVSCSKQEVNPYSESIWVGRYPIQTVNGTTGETVDLPGEIILTFQKDGDQCGISFGIEGMYGVTARNYEVHWSDNTHFTLYSAAGEQALVCYSGVISRDRMSLQSYNCDSVAATYELSRVLHLLE